MTIRQIKLGPAKAEEKPKPKRSRKHKAEEKEPEIAEEISLPVIKFKDLEGKFLHVKVGNDNDPNWKDANFSNTEVAKVEEKFLELLEKNEINCLVFVTHHAVEINLIESCQKGFAETESNAK